MYAIHGTIQDLHQHQKIEFLESMQQLHLTTLSINTTADLCISYITRRNSQSSTTNYPHLSQLNSTPLYQQNSTRYDETNPKSQN